MEMGWTGLVRTVAVTAMVTSAAWVVAGAWWLQGNPHLKGRSITSAYAAEGTTGAVPVAGERQLTPIPFSPMQSPVPVTPAAPTSDNLAAIGPLIVPVSGVLPVQLIDTFTQARSEERQHDAIDIPALRGAAVIAAAEGTVERIYFSKAGGLTAYVRSPDRRIIFYYAHLDTYVPGLAEGQLLRQGDPIGTVGFTGNANPAAPHLHFAVLFTMPERKWYEAASAINPYPLLVKAR